MQSSLYRLTRGQHRNIGTAAAAAAVASILVLKDRPEEDAEDKNGALNRSVYSRSPWTCRSRISQCDSAAVLGMGVPARHARTRLRRHSTVAELEETSTKERLETKYRVLWKKPLGEGAFGAVYPATHRETGEKVAVKQINKKFTDDRTFQREMDAMLLLEKNGGHPNICGMREHYDRGDNFCIVLDLVSGREMFDQLCHFGPYSEADAARHVQEAASALAFLHGIGIIHTDIKPENMMFSSKDSDDAVIKIVDFGCAHLQKNAPFCDHKQKGTANTPAYSSPEVLREARENKHRHPMIEPSFDMWSLGVVIYIMLIGAHPFDIDCCASNEEIAERIISGEKPPLRNFQLAEHLSEDAMALIEGLLEHDPQKRLTAEQVLENRWVRGETATSKKIADSDKKLATFRKYKTQIGSTFFKMLLSQTDAIHRSKTKERVSVLEAAFRRLDTGRTGYLSTNELRGRVEEGEEEDAKMSYSDISTLLAENMKNHFFKKDHVIYNEGDTGGSMYLINSGTVEIRTKEGFKKLREGGEIFGEEVMRNKNRVHHNTVRCMTPVHVMEIPRDLFKKYVTSDKETFLSMEETERHRRRERANTILRLNKECRRQSYHKGDKIFKEGDEGDNLYLLDAGEIDISVQGHNVRSLHQGEMTGEHAAYFGKPYNVTAQCVSKRCELQMLPSRAMHTLFRSDPSLHQDFRDLMFRRDFKKALCATTGKTFPKTEEDIRTAFDVIDTNQSGEISFERLREIVWRFDSAYNEDDIRDMLESLDLNKSGSLTWAEFHRIFSMDKEA